MMNKLDVSNGTCLDIVPCHAVDTTSGRVGKLVERARREVEIVVCASYAAIHYSACYAFALVMRSQLLSTNRVLIRVDTIITWVSVK